MNGQKPGRGRLRPAERSALPQIWSQFRRKPDAVVKATAKFNRRFPDRQRRAEFLEQFFKEPSHGGRKRRAITKSEPRKTRRTRRRKVAATVEGIFTDAMRAGRVAYEKAVRPFMGQLRRLAEPGVEVAAKLRAAQAEAAKYRKKLRRVGAVSRV